MLSTLFRNLHNHKIACGYLQFTENDEAIAQLSVLDFAAKTKTCTKGYSCGKSCISPSKNCRNPLEGQAKNYAEFLKLTQQPKDLPINLADFESVKALGEKIAEKYLVPPKQELIDEQNRLQQAKDSLAQKLNVLIQDSNVSNDELEKVIDEFHAVEREWMGAKDTIATQQGVKFEQLREDLIKAGGKDQSDTQSWIASVKRITPVTKKSESALREAYQLLGGNLPTLQAVGKTQSRAFASKPTNQKYGFINVGKNTKGNDVIFHEVGHHLEYSFPELVESANAFIAKRSAGRSPQTLRQLTGIKGYKKDEIALPDEFIDPYVGKIYKDRSTEVISMGIERFTSPEEMYKFKQKDPEHFHFILGVIAHVNKFKA